MRWGKVLLKGVKGAFLAGAGVGAEAVLPSVLPAVAAALPVGFPTVAVATALSALVNWFKHRKA